LQRDVEYVARSHEHYAYNDNIDNAGKYAAAPKKFRGCGSILVGTTIPAAAEIPAE